MKRPVRVALVVLCVVFLAVPAEAKKKKEPDPPRPDPVAAAPAPDRGGAAGGAVQGAGGVRVPAVAPDVVGIQAQVDGALRASEVLKSTTLDQLREITLVSQQLQHHRQILDQSQVVSAGALNSQQAAQQAIEMEKVRLIAEEALRQQRVLSQVQQLQSQNLEVLRTLQAAQDASRLVLGVRRVEERRNRRRRRESHARAGRDSGVFLQDE